MCATESVPIISEESGALIVKGLSPQEDIAPEIKVTLPAIEPNIPIIEECLPQKIIAPETKTTLPSTSPEVKSSAAIDPRYPLSTPMRDQFSFPFSPCSRKAILSRDGLILYFLDVLLDLTLF